MLDQKQVLYILKSLGAILDGHFVYTSGKHGDKYINKDALYPHTAKTSLLCRSLAKHFAIDGVEAVLSPAVGSVIISQWTAYHLYSMTSREVLSLYADRTSDDQFILKRGYDSLIRGKRVLVGEDLTTTGGSVRKVVEVARAAGGIVIGAGTLCNRGEVTAADVGVVPKFVALADIKMNAWSPAECPLCAKGIPITEGVGHGSEYLAGQAATRENRAAHGNELPDLALFGAR